MELLRTQALTTKLVSDHALETNGAGSTAPAGGQPAAAAAARRAAARQRRLALQQMRKQQQRERRQRQQQMRQLRRQGALAASTTLDSVDLEMEQSAGNDAVGAAQAAAAAGPSSSSGRQQQRPRRLLSVRQGSSLQNEGLAAAAAGSAGPLAAAGRAVWWLTGGLLGFGPQQDTAGDMARLLSAQHNSVGAGPHQGPAEDMAGLLSAPRSSGVSDSRDAVQLLPLADSAGPGNSTAAASVSGSGGAALTATGSEQQQASANQQPAGISSSSSIGRPAHQPQQQQEVANTLPVAAAAGHLPAAFGTKAQAEPVVLTASSPTAAAVASTEAFSSTVAQPGDAVITVLPVQCQGMTPLPAGTSLHPASAGPAVIVTGPAVPQAFPRIASPVISSHNNSSSNIGAVNAAASSSLQPAGGHKGGANASGSPCSECYLGQPDPLELAAAAKLQLIQQQAAQDRVSGPLSEPLSQFMGYLTGVMPAWPNMTAAGPGNLGQQQQQQGQRKIQHHDGALQSAGLQNQAVHMQPAPAVPQLIPLGPEALICLSSSHGSGVRGSGGASSSSSSAEIDDDVFWDVQQSGQFINSSSGSIYFDAAAEDADLLAGGPQPFSSWDSDSSATAAKASGRQDLAAPAAALAGAHSAAPSVAAAGRFAHVPAGSYTATAGNLSSSSPFAATAAAAASRAAAEVVAPQAHWLTVSAFTNGPSSHSSISSNTTTATASPFAALAATPALSLLESQLPMGVTTGSPWEQPTSDRLEGSLASIATSLAGGLGPFPPSGNPASAPGGSAEAAGPPSTTSSTQNALGQGPHAHLAVSGLQGRPHDTASLLASSSTAAMLGALQDFNPVSNLGPGGATAMLLNPARTAPQALFNPAAALAGIRTPDDDSQSAKEEGTLSSIISKVVGSSGSSMSGRSSPGSRSTDSSGPSRPSTSGSRVGEGVVGAVEGAGAAVEGVMGMAGLKPPKHSAAGTMADTTSGSDGSSSGSRRSRVGRTVRRLLPGHSKSSSNADSTSSSGGSIGGGGSTSGGSKHGADCGEEPAEQRRYLYSLDVRRLSLASPLLPGSKAGDAAVMQTRNHLPVLMEEGEGDAS